MIDSTLPTALRSFRWFGLFIVLGLCAAFSSALARAQESKQDADFYERKIRPLLAQRCYECHSRSSKRPEGGLTLDTRAGVIKGGESGPIINSDNAGESLLLQVVGYAGDIQMPPTGKLSAAELELLPLEHYGDTQIVTPNEFLARLA